MQTAWFALIALMLTTYAVLDGFDFGAGMIHLLVARTDEERRIVFAAIGPVWDANEVWLVASGGVLVLAFPRAYAAAFSGFYLPLMMVLWLLILRGVSIHVRSHLGNPLWRSLWDVVFAGSSAVLGIVLGASLGNVIRGVPIDATGYFDAPLFTNFRVGAQPGALDWYTLLVGAFAALALANHGALYLAWKTSGVVNARSVRLAKRLSIGVTALGGVVTLATGAVAPALFRDLARPSFWAPPLAIVASTVALFILLWRGRELPAFLASCAALASTLASTALILYPTILRSTIDPAFSLDAFNASAGRTSLVAGLAMWIPAVVLAIGYVVFVFRMHRGKVRIEEGGH